MTLPVGIVQFAPSDDRDTNWQTVRKHVSDLSSKGARLIVLPEMFVCEYHTETMSSHKETIPGPTTDFLAQIAKEFNVYIIGGTIPHEDGGDLYNTCVVVSNEGEIIGTYSKMHLFQLYLPGTHNICEADVFKPGKTRFSFEIDGFKVGVGVCFDVRFADLAIDYAVEDDCNVLVYPSAFTAYTGPLHWKTLGQARSLDSQCWVIMVSSSYDEKARFKGHGSSFVSTPSGQIHREIDRGEGNMLVNLTMKDVDVSRSALPVVTIHKQKRSNRME